jgi:quinol monooxygenase YgiN
MITRIVRMEFKSEKLSDFLAIFKNSKKQIRNFSGCRHLAIYEDATNENVRYTYSLWETEADLETYRKSELFKTTWSATKVLFAAKAQAFSLGEREIVESI